VRLRPDHHRGAHVGRGRNAAPPEPADQFQIFYDPAASQATFDMQSVPPRSFTAAGVEGTFALPGLSSRRS